MEHKGLRYLIGLFSLLLIMASSTGVITAHASTDGILSGGQLTGADEVVYTYDIVDEALPAGEGGYEEFLTEEGGYEEFPAEEDCIDAGLTLLMAGEPEPDGSGTAYYDMLTAEQKGAYTALKNAVNQYIKSDTYAADITAATSDIKATVKSDYKLENKDAKAVFEAFYRDNTQFYFLEASYSCAVYTDGYTIGTLVSDEYYSADLRYEVDEAVETVTQEWLAQLNSILTDSDAEPDATKREYLAALRLHDLIIDRINYAYDSSGSPETGKFAHSIAGVCTGEGVVCEGYADMFSYILNLLGIDNMIVTGRATSENHAWNSIELGGEYFLVDVTWDDSNPKSKSDYRGDSYEYFCMPSNLFKREHTPDSGWKYPAFSSKTDYAFVYYFESVTDTVMTEGEAQTFRDNALAHQYKGCDYVYFTVPKDSLSAMSKALGLASFNYSSSEYGCTIKYLCPKIDVPSATVAVYRSDLTDTDAVATMASIEVKGCAGFVAEVADGSDDRIAWSVSDTKIAKLTTNGKRVTVTGRRNGTVTLTAKTYAGGAVATCVVVVGTGTSTADFYVWAGGTAANKKVTITPTIKATNWKDARGRDKTGKLVWLTSDEDIEIQFDTAKHTVKTKVISKRRLSVNTKGEITAKKPGRAYVYICDTGSCTYESYSVEVLAAPSKLYLSSTAESYAKSDLVNKVGLNVLSVGKVYIVPYLRDFDVDGDCTYSVETAKDEQKKYVSLSNVLFDEEGNPYFSVTATDYSHEAGKAAKPVSVRITAVNAEANKKVSMTVVIGNPTVSVSATPKTSGKLAKKNDTVEFSLSVVSKMGAAFPTTDSVKLYVGKTSVELNSTGKTVVADKGATVKVTLSKDKKSFIVKAGKDAGATAVVTLAVKDAVTKKYTLYELFRVDEEGNIL